MDKRNSNENEELYREMEFASHYADYNVETENGKNREEVHIDGEKEEERQNVIPKNQG